jgi:hypothetical protein
MTECQGESDFFSCMERNKRTLNLLKYRKNGYWVIVEEYGFQIGMVRARKVREATLPACAAPHVGRSANMVMETETPYVFHTLGDNTGRFWIFSTLKEVILCGYG